MAGPKRPTPIRGPLGQRRSGVAADSRDSGELARAPVLSNPSRNPTSARNQELGYTSNTLLTLLAIVPASLLVSVSHEYDGRTRAPAPPRQDVTAGQPLTLALPTAAAPFRPVDQGERPQQRAPARDEPYQNILASTLTLRDVMREGVFAERPQQRPVSREDTLPVPLTLTLPPAVAAAPFPSSETLRGGQRQWRGLDVDGQPLVIRAPPGPTIFGNEVGRPQPARWNKHDPTGQPLTLLAPPGPTIFGNETHRPQATRWGRDDPAPIPLALAAQPPPAPFAGNEVGRPQPSRWNRQDPTGEPLALLAPPGPRVATNESLGGPQASRWNKVDPIGQPLVLVAPPGPTIFGSEAQRGPLPTVWNRADLYAQPLTLPVLAAPAPFFGAEWQRGPVPTASTRQDPSSAPLTLRAPPGPTIFGNETLRPALGAWQRHDPTGLPLVIIAPPGPTIFGSELARPLASRVAKDDPLPLNLPLLLLPTAPPQILGNETNYGARPVQLPWSTQDVICEPLTLTLPPAIPIINPPVFDVNFGGGGGGFHKGKKYRKRHLHIDVILRDVEAIYAELTGTPSRKVAGEIIRPYAATRAKVPRPQSVDWAALERDARIRNELVALWNQYQIDLDDEEVLLLLGG